MVDRSRAAAGLAGLLVGAGLGLGPAPAVADPTDFVVQQVCVDAADRPIAGDPMHCPKARKVGVGEPIPYRRVDAGNWQALFAYPVRGLGGETRVMAAKVFGGADTTGSFGDLGVRSGYDLLEVGAAFVSGIRTSDPGGGDQIFWRTTDCIRTDGWIFFPPGLKPGEHGEARSTLRITPGPSTACPSLWRIGPDYTVWDRPTEPYRFTSGKVLETIQSMHFAYGDPENPAHDNDSMEKFYFTKPYGYSRWEAWETPVGCQKRAAKTGADPAETCRPSPAALCDGPNTATFFGKLYVRLDCRDSTFFVADPDRPFDPLVSGAAPGDILSRNLLSNGTFANGVVDWTSTPEGDVQVGAARQPRSTNAVLRVSGASGRAGLNQEAVIPPDMQAAGRVLRWGVSLGSVRPSANAIVTLTLSVEGAPDQVSRHAVEMAPSLRPAVFTQPLPDGGGRPIRVRFDLRLDAPVDATVDDAFVAVLDRDSAH